MGFLGSSFSPSSLLLGFYLRKKGELATLTGRAPELALWLGSVSRPCPPLVLVLAAPELCGWSLWPGLLERSVAEQIAMSMPTKIH